MLYFGRAKTALILGICVLGALLCLPNLLPAPASWVPWRQVHLGLDLRGGSYLLLQVDMDAVRKERLDTILDRARQALTGKYRTIAQPSGEARVSVALRDASQTQPAIDTLKATAINPEGGQDFNIATVVSLVSAGHQARAMLLVGGLGQPARMQAGGIGHLEPMLDPPVEVAVAQDREEPRDQPGPRFEPRLMLPRLQERELNEVVALDRVARQRQREAAQVRHRPDQVGPEPVRGIRRLRGIERLRQALQHLTEARSFVNGHNFWVDFPQICSGPGLRACDDGIHDGRRRQMFVDVQHGRDTHVSREAARVLDRRPSGSATINL